jgi:hypothetical protein
VCAFMVLARVVIDLAAGTCVEDAALLIDNCGTSTAHSSGAINFASNGDMIIFNGEHAAVSEPLLYAHIARAAIVCSFLQRCHNNCYLVLSVN